MMVPSGRTDARPRAVRGRRVVAVLSTAVLAVGAVGCSELDSASDKVSDGIKGDSGQDKPEQVADPELTTNLGKGNGVAIDTRVTVGAKNGEISDVLVRAQGGKKLPGRVRNGSWQAAELLDPNQTYVVRATVKDAAGKQRQLKQRFTSANMDVKTELTYPSVSPIAGQEVGVGMPVVVRFDVPVTNHKAAERRLKVTSTPAQQGSWHWISDYEVHWRPKEYWQAGTKVHVDADLHSVPVGNGIYGQLDRDIDFTVGDAVISRVNMQTHEMKTFVNGKLVHTFPITTGKEGFTTRSGVKVIMEKFESRRMNSETVGISQDSAEGYDIDDVQWAMRVTNSGEFIHAAPWSVGSQGAANVSHGCTGMSTEDAGTLYSMSKIGDVVEYTGSDRPMTLDNGYGDWNDSFKEYSQGSAL